MRLRLLVVSVMVLAATTLACSLASGTPNNAPTPAPQTPTATTPPIAPIQGAATATTMPPIGVRTPTSVVSATITATATATLTTTVTVAAPTVTPHSSGPLDFQVSVVGCRNDASREGGVILTFKVEATGGNGVYTYIREGQVVPQVSDRPATKGTAVIDAWQVQSGDGQQIEKKFRFTGQEFGCK